MSPITSSVSASKLRTLHTLLRTRIDLAKRQLSELQPAQVHKRWDMLRIIRQATACPIRGVMCDSLHAVRTHIGKSHPEQSQAKTKQSYADKSRIDNNFMKHAYDGKPECAHCRKQFSTWKAYMGHWQQQACPIWHSPTTGHFTKEATSSLADGASVPERAPASQSETFTARLVAPRPAPLFERVDVQTAARSGSEADLPALVRDEINQGHCPICRYKCENNMYLARHACKQHPEIARPEAEVRQWTQARSGIGQPCRWCKVGPKQTSKAHQRACPVLWACGHLLHAFHTLLPSGQTDLSRHVRRAGTRNAAGSPGAPAVRGICEEAGKPFFRPLSLPSTGPPSLTGQEMDTKDTEMRADEDPGNEPQSSGRRPPERGRQPRRPGQPNQGLASFFQKRRPAPLVEEGGGGRIQEGARGSRSWS